jgi:hypothetical protein
VKVVKEQLEFRGIEALPKDWRVYFSQSEVGKTYTVLRKIEESFDSGSRCKTCGSMRNDYIYSNTEYQNHVTARLIDLCSGLTQPKVLVVGYGMGEFIPFLESIDSDLTILEKYEQVLNLDENIGIIRSRHRIIVGDHDKIDLSILGTGYDIIFIQIMSQHRVRKREMEAILSESGTCIYV